MGWPLRGDRMVSLAVELGLAAGVVGGPWAGVALIVSLACPVGRLRLAAKWPAVSRCRSMLCRFPNEVVMVAMVQVRRPSAGQAYYRRKPAEGESPKEALRWLKRRLSDAVYRCLLADQLRCPSQTTAACHPVTFSERSEAILAPQGLHGT